MALKIDDYIKDAKKLGLSREQIKASLEKQGWRQSEIAEALDRAFPYTGKSIVAKKRDIPEGDISGFALAGIIFAIVFPLLGLIFSIIALNKIKNNPKLRGKTLAILGVVFSISIIILTTLLLLDGMGVISIGFAQKFGINPPEETVKEEPTEEPLPAAEEVQEEPKEAVEEPEKPEEEAPKKTVQEKIEETITFEEWDGCGIKGILECEKHELDRLGNLILEFRNIAGDDIYVTGMRASHKFNMTSTLECHTTKRVLIGKARTEEFELKCEGMPSGNMTLDLDLEVDYRYQMETYKGKGMIPLEIS